MARSRTLRQGYTTGACAAAAAKGATLLLLDAPSDQVTLPLPWDSDAARPVGFRLVGKRKGDAWATAGVMKNGGDDPDVTHGMEIRATVTRLCETSRTRSRTEPIIEILGGQGVGRVTRPGLAAPVGEAAINPVPRRMIEAAVRQALDETEVLGFPGLRVVISAPEGEERARRTMNARLGILGGISILGTTGIVIPMSAAAWTATIDACLDVARASGAQRALLAFGRTSERAGQAQFPDVAENAAVLMGDHVGYALDAAASRDLDIVIAGQFAKFCKLAAGSFDTHVREGALEPKTARELLLRAGFGEEEASGATGANTAREIFENLLVAENRGFFEWLAQEVAHRAADRVGRRVAVEAALFDYGGRCLAQVAVGREEVRR